jgi:hypothetical protein
MASPIFDGLLACFEDSIAHQNTKMKHSPGEMLAATIRYFELINMSQFKIVRILNNETKENNKKINRCM